MTLEEAIKHCEDVICDGKCDPCENEHRQLAEWLRELQERRKRPEVNRRKHDLPIILSHDTRTGIMIFPNRNMGGRDMMIVGLSREVPSGESFDFKDVDWIKSVLHFGDVDSLSVTVECLTKELKRWKNERRTDE